MLKIDCTEGMLLVDATNASTLHNIRHSALLLSHTIKPAPFIFITWDVLFSNELGNK